MDPLRALVFSTTPMGIFEQSRALLERDWLGAMAVDFYAPLHREPWARIPSGRLRSWLSKRHRAALNSARVRVHPVPSIAAKAALQILPGEHVNDRVVFWQNDMFDRWVRGLLPIEGNLAFGYESCSLHTFRRAEQLSIPRVLYQPIGCAESAMEILGEEGRRYPQLQSSLRYAWFTPAEIARRREERELADAILCASSFTKATLVAAGVDPSKVFVEPYGVDQSLFAPARAKFDRFSVIWASSYTQTKGIGYLLEALERNAVPGAELVLVGYPFGPDITRDYEGRVRIRRFGRLPRSELAPIMAKCHAHVFPTLLDGFGRNLVEAMSSGLPVVTTPNCAGPDLIEDGVTGFVVPIRDPGAIAERLAWIAAHPIEAEEMGRRARERVASLTEADYRSRFASRIHDIFTAQRGARAA